MIRKPAVAGSFYAGTRERLRGEAADLLVRDVPRRRALAVVAPHAGYRYSGRVAGAVYSRIEFPETFVILGPNHTGLGAGAAIMTGGAWETPLGAVEIDVDLARAIQGASDILEEDHLGHLKEHSIEVQLPLLQACQRPFRFVPICLFSHELAACQNVGRAVAAAVQAAGKPVVLVASTDFSHYISHEEAQTKDRKAIDAILTIDPEGLYDVVRRQRITMCGFHPTTAVLFAARELGASQAELVQYMTSGDVTKDFSSVVGYAGIVIR